MVAFFCCWAVFLCRKIKEFCVKVWKCLKWIYVNIVDTNFIYKFNISKDTLNFFNLSLVDHMHKFNSADCFLGSVKTIKSKHGFDLSLNKTMILINNIVQSVYI